MTCAVSHHERPAIELESSMMRTVSKVVKGVGVFCDSGRGVGSGKGAGGKGPNDGARCPSGGGCIGWGRLVGRGGGVGELRLRSAGWMMVA